jgi:ATP phosphoribosyltransferase regulatory subunit
MNQLAATALLPPGMMDLVPPHAAIEADAVERLVRSFAGFGYERIKAPLIEFEETLLAGSGAALANQTFRLMDPMSQRMLALRPDMTMQVARIAATRLGHRPRPLRLSYAGQVVRVRGTQLAPERQLGQVGAELVGSPAPAADVEVIAMAASALADLGLGGLSVDLGIPTLVPAVLAGLAIGEPVRLRLLTALDRKDVTAVESLADDIGRETSALLASLIVSAGPAEGALAALAAARLPPSAASGRTALEAVCRGLTEEIPELAVTIDAVEHRGFVYHSGVTFSLFARAVPGELGRGGRYRTEAGEDATGITLSMDPVLKGLPARQVPARLFLPRQTPPDAARRLRDQGWITVAALENDEPPEREAVRLGCTHVFADGIVRDLPAAAAAPTPFGA